MTDNNILNEVVTSLRTLSGVEQNVYLKRGELLLLVKESKAYGKSFRRWLIENVCDLWGVKPITLENNMRVVKAIGADLKDLDIIPSRVEAFLPYYTKTGKNESNGKFLDTVKECCLKDIPAVVFKDSLNRLKGSPERPECHCETTGKGFETWHKMKCCGKWSQES